MNTPNNDYSYKILSKAGIIELIQTNYFFFNWNNIDSSFLKRNLK